MPRDKRDRSPSLREQGWNAAGELMRMLKAHAFDADSLEDFVDGACERLRGAVDDARSEEQYGHMQKPSLDDYFQGADERMPKAGLKSTLKAMGAGRMAKRVVSDGFIDHDGDRVLFVVEHGPGSFAGLWLDRGRKIGTASLSNDRAALERTLRAQALGL